SSLRCNTDIAPTGTPLAAIRSRRGEEGNPSRVPLPRRQAMKKAIQRSALALALVTVSAGAAFAQAAGPAGPSGGSAGAVTTATPSGGASGVGGATSPAPVVPPSTTAPGAAATPSPATPPALGPGTTTTTTP